MDVEGRFVWIPVRTVLIVRRCVITSRWGHGPQALRALRACASQTHPYGGILPPYPLPRERMNI